MLGAQPRARIGACVLVQACRSFSWPAGRARRRPDQRRGNSIYTKYGRSVVQDYYYNAHARKNTTIGFSITAVCPYFCGGIAVKCTRSAF